MAFLKARDPKGKLCFSDIRGAEHLPLPMEQLDQQIHAVMPDGSIINRMDVIRAVYREVGLGWIATLMDWPVLRPCFDVLYGGIAKYRHAISRWWR